MLVIDNRSKVAIYEQIKNQILELITVGALTPHTQLPSIRVLASELSLNVNTVKKAFGDLENARVIKAVLELMNVQQEEGSPQDDSRILYLTHNFAHTLAFFRPEHTPVAVAVRACEQSYGVSGSAVFAKLLQFRLHFLHTPFCTGREV